MVLYVLFLHIITAVNTVVWIVFSILHWRDRKAIAPERWRAYWSRKPWYTRSDVHWLISTGCIIIGIGAMVYGWFSFIKVKHMDIVLIIIVGILFAAVVRILLFIWDERGL